MVSLELNKVATRWQNNGAAPVEVGRRKKVRSATTRRPATFVREVKAVGQGSSIHCTPPQAPNEIEERRSDRLMGDRNFRSGHTIGWKGTWRTLRKPLMQIMRPAQRYV